MGGGMQAAGHEEWKDCPYCGTQATLLTTGAEAEAWCTKCHKRVIFKYWKKANDKRLAKLAKNSSVQSNGDEKK